MLAEAQRERCGSELRKRWRWTVTVHLLALERAETKRTG